MTWEKLKEKIVDHIVKVVLTLVTFLCLIVWQAVPSETWAQLGAVIPKRVLAALIGLLVIALATLTAYIFSLHKGRKPLQGRITSLQREVSDLKEKQIPKMQERTAELASQLQEAEIQKRRLQKENDELSYSLTFDETIDKMLLMLTEGHQYPISIAKKLELHKARAEYFLIELEKRHYVKSTSSSSMYIIDQRGREYLVKKGLV
jgi:predicted RNase H-like nuclease (RuvC/YqgF family)